MSWPKELEKDHIEQSAIISAFCQLMDMRFKGEPFHETWRRNVKDKVIAYSHNILGINEEQAKKNITIVAQRREQKKLNFNSLEEAIAYVESQKGNSSN